jgi:hypothetical protein
VLSVQDVVERSREKSNMLQGFSDTVLRAEALEEQLLKSRKHAAAMQSKLDAAFAKYHNDVQELQAKGDDLVRKNKSLRNKNKGTPLDLSGSCWRSRGSLTRCTIAVLQSLRARWARSTWSFGLHLTAISSTATNHCRS